MGHGNARFRSPSRSPSHPAVIVHRLIDQSESEKTAESGWGVVRHSGRPKPAYCALADARGAPCSGR